MSEWLGDYFPTHVITEIIGVKSRCWGLCCATSDFYLSWWDRDVHAADNQSENSFPVVNLNNWNYFMSFSISRLGYKCGRTVDTAF